MYPKRFAARLFLISPFHRVLLFRFAYKTGPLAGLDYWATPGGKLEEGESYEEAAIRELYEETGFIACSVGSSVANKKIVWKNLDGTKVFIYEKYFVVNVDKELISENGWSATESEVTIEYRWWSKSDLKKEAKKIWPSDILDILSNLI